METFPTFPDHIGISYGESIYEDPTIKTEFENGWEEVRSRRSKGRFISFRVTYRLSEADADVLLQFLIARRLQQEPFYYHHPLLGTGVVRYARDELPTRVLVQGNPVWYEIELEFRQQYSG